MAAKAARSPNRRRSGCAGGAPSSSSSTARSRSRSGRGAFPPREYRLHRLHLDPGAGDLDRVFQADAPSSVSSFLQRMGRTGRRAWQTAKTVAFSYKTRGFCPSCRARRISSTGFCLPWLLSYPRWLRLQARRLGLPGPKTGAVCFTRRFGSQLNLNLHHYALVPDGGFPAPEDGAVSFEKLPRPRGAERCRSTCRSDRPRPARADCPGGRRAPSPPGPPALPSGGDRRGAPLQLVVVS